MRDRGYLDWVKSIRVCFVQIWIERTVARLMEIEDHQERADAEFDFALAVAEHGRCWGPYDPDHMGADRGAGLKASDDTAVCMCRKHHGQRHDHSGFFHDWSDLEREKFCEAGIEWTQRMRRQHEKPEEGLPW